MGIYMYIYIYNVLVYIDEDYHTCTCIYAHTPLYTLVKGNHHATYFTAYIHGYQLPYC